MPPSWRFPDRRAGTGLYAFVEANGGMTEQEASEFLAQSLGETKAPEQLQLVEALPRDAARRGANRDPLPDRDEPDRPDRAVDSRDDAERAVTARIVADRRNLRDRFDM